MRHTEEPKWCELGRSAHSRMYVRPADANTELTHTHPWMQTGRAHTHGYNGACTLRGCNCGTHTRGCNCCNAHTSGLQARSAHIRGCKDKTRTHRRMQVRNAYTPVDANAKHAHTWTHTRNEHNRGCEPGTRSGPHTRSCPACWSTFGYIPPPCSFRH